MNRQTAGYLDAILNRLMKDEVGVPRFNEIITLSDLELINLEATLETDGYIRPLREKGGSPAGLITPSGRKFMIEGGYSGKLNEESKNGELNSLKHENLLLQNENLKLQNRVLRQRFLYASLGFLGGLITSHLEKIAEIIGRLISKIF